MSCIFGPALGCKLFCGDDNSCTLNYCDAAGVCGKTNIPEGTICEDERGMEGRCTADAVCVELPPEMQP
jgi:hypothetical protein